MGESRMQQFHQGKRMRCPSCSLLPLTNHWALVYTQHKSRPACIGIFWTSLVGTWKEQEVIFATTWADFHELRHLRPAWLVSLLLCASANFELVVPRGFTPMHHNFWRLTSNFATINTDFNQKHHRPMGYIQQSMHNKSQKWRSSRMSKTEEPTMQMEVAWDVK